LYDPKVSDPFPRDRILEELHALRDATRELHRRLEALIGEVAGEAPADPRIVEIARRAIEELRAKQRARRLAPAAGAARTGLAAASTARRRQQKAD
jgi:hypothetical protein